MPFSKHTIASAVYSTVYADTYLPFQRLKSSSLMLFYGRKKIVFNIIVRPIYGRGLGQTIIKNKTILRLKSL